LFNGKEIELALHGENFDRLRSMIGLIDYGSGNLPSVRQALQREGASVRLVQSPENLEGVRAIVLPGVGAFGDCVRNLKERALWKAIDDWLKTGKPYLGICLGFQLLFESSEESAGEKGFGFFRGKVRRFWAPNIKVPHIGWNRLDLKTDALWNGLPDAPYAYFVHSYFPVPDDNSIVTATATHGQVFAAAAARNRVAATQFHPEKSQAVGLTILRNFLAMI
jgi:glutamine amidotransferase